MGVRSPGTWAIIHCLPRNYQEDELEAEQLGLQQALEMECWCHKLPNLLCLKHILSPASRQCLLYIFPSSCLPAIHFLPSYLLLQAHVLRLRSKPLFHVAKSPGLVPVAELLKYSVALWYLTISPLN